MVGEFETLARLYHANPVFFTITLIGAMLFVAYQAVRGPIRNQCGRRIPRYRFPLFLALLALETAWVIYIVWKVRNR